MKIEIDNRYMEMQIKNIDLKMEMKMKLEMTIEV